MKDKGFNSHRLKKSIYERAFAKVWAEYNCDPSGEVQLVECLLAHKGEAVSDRDRQVAATIVQWLGSSVGMDFINEVFGKIRNMKWKELLERDDNCSVVYPELQYTRIVSHKGG